jgi:hypothetical protein
MNNNMFLFLIVPVLLLSGCSRSVPKCSDKETIKIVKQLLTDTIYEASPLLNAVKEKLHIDFRLDAIRTKSTDKETGAHECAADYKVGMKLVNVSQESQESQDLKDSFVIGVSDAERQGALPGTVDYTVQLTDKGEVYVVLK